jgi:hypothetical protein
MAYSSPPLVPLDFEPDSIYLVFIMRADRPCAGVFHHHSDNKGILAYADVGIPGPRKSHRKVFSFELDNSEAPHLELSHVRLTPSAIRDRNRIYYRRRVQSGESSLPQVVAKRELRFLRTCRREPMDGGHLAPPRYEVGAEEAGLDEPSGDRAARVQEARKEVCPNRVILDPGLLYTRAGEWLYWTAKEGLL